MLLVKGDLNLLPKKKTYMLFHLMVSISQFSKSSANTIVIGRFNKNYKHLNWRRQINKTHVELFTFNLPWQFFFKMDFHRNKKPVYHFHQSHSLESWCSILRVTLLGDSSMFWCYCYISNKVRIGWWRGGGLYWTFV